MRVCTRTISRLEDGKKKLAKMVSSRLNVRMQETEEK